MPWPTCDAVLRWTLGCMGCSGRRWKMISQSIPWLICLKWLFLRGMLDQWDLDGKCQHWAPQVMQFVSVDLDIFLGLLTNLLPKNSTEVPTRLENWSLRWCVDTSAEATSLIHVVWNARQHFEVEFICCQPSLDVYTLLESEQACRWMPGASPHLILELKGMDLEVWKMRSRGFHGLAMPSLLFIFASVQTVLDPSKDVFLLIFILAVLGLAIVPPTRLCCDGLWRMFRIFRAKTKIS